MLNALNFVKGAVARKDFAPVLTHFFIDAGRITGYNGRMALSSPIDLDLTLRPKAIEFIKALNTCKGVISMHAMPNGSLVVKSGAFKALVQCSTDPFPKLDITGTEVELSHSLLAPLKMLAPFISEDASREWSRGILFRGQTAVATNNIVIVEAWLKSVFPIEVNLPKNAVVELLRIGIEPDKMIVRQAPNDAGELEVVGCTFMYPNGRWLMTHTISTQWPDITRVFARSGEPKPIPPTLFSGVDDISPFCDEDRRIFLSSGTVSTVPGIHVDAGTSSEVEGLTVTDGCFNADALASLRSIATSLDLAAYPAPCLFYGDMVRGVIVGKLYAV